MPAEVVGKLNDLVLKELRDPEVQAAFSTQAATPAGATPAAFAAQIQAEADRWLPDRQSGGDQGQLKEASVANSNSPALDAGSCSFGASPALCRGCTGECLLIIVVPLTFCGPRQLLASSGIPSDAADSACIFVIETGFSWSG